MTERKPHSKTEMLLLFFILIAVLSGPFLVSKILNDDRVGEIQISLDACQQDLKQALKNDHRDERGRYKKAPK
jgi:hypothetical protein